MTRLTLLLLVSMVLLPGSVAADGQDPSADVTGLLVAIEDGNEQTREGAIRLLGQIWPMRPAIVEAIAARLYDQSDLVYNAAVQALAGMGARAAPALGDLLRTLDHYPRPTRGAVLALGSAGQGSRRAVPHLARILEGDRALAPEAAEALGRIGPLAGDAVPALLRSLRRLGPNPEPRPERRERARVLAALAHIGAPGIPLLRSALSDPSAAVRSGAVHALARMEASLPALESDFAALLDDPSPLVRTEVAEAMSILWEYFSGRASPTRIIVEEMGNLPLPR